MEFPSVSNEMSIIADVRTALFVHEKSTPHTASQTFCLSKELSLKWLLLEPVTSTLLM